MIAHLSGTLLSKEPNQVIVDVGGVGYDVTIPLSTFYDLDDEKSKIELLIYTYVKEDALQLYGFKTPSERKLFIHFISVSGIGPKLGIALLSHGKTDDLIESIKSNNLARLTQIPGIGRKTAERLVVDPRKTQFEAMRFRRSLIWATNGQRLKKPSIRRSVRAATSRSSRS
jgi:Holliday junction DNA helicase RuvA